MDNAPNERRRHSELRSPSGKGPKILRNDSVLNFNGTILKDNSDRVRHKAVIITSVGYQVVQCSTKVGSNSRWPISKCPPYC